MLHGIILYRTYCFNDCRLLIQKSYLLRKYAISDTAPVRETSQVLIEIQSLPLQTKLVIKIHFAGYHISHLPSCCRCYRVNSESTACKRVVTWLGTLFWCGGLICAWLGKQISGWLEAGQAEWCGSGRDRPGDRADWKRQLKRTGNILGRAYYLLFLQYIVCIQC